MVYTISQLPRRQSIFAVFVIFVFGTSAFEIISEFAAGETLSDMADDVGRFALSAIVILAFVYEYRVQRKALRILRQQLSVNPRGLSEIEPQASKLASEYRTVMERQFDVWQLTESERDVVLLMLKGLSFREIAQLRETREKTVRQQASTVYRKADVSSRHELAAWFFEDILEPNFNR